MPDVGPVAGSSGAAGGDPTMGGDLTGTASNAQIAAGAIVDADVSGTAAIAKSKLASLAIANADVAAGAAIAKSKLASLAIADADVAAGAAIAYSKLSLGTSIVNADVATGAAIAVTKLAPSGTNSQVLTTVSGAPAWAAAAGGAPSGTAGGDLGGSYPNPTVIAIESATTSVNLNAATAPSASQVLVATDSTHATWATISNASVSASAAISRSKLVVSSNVYEMTNGTYATMNPFTVQGTNVFTANHGRIVRVIWPKTGTLSDITVWLTAAAGNCIGVVYDTGQQNADHTIRTRLDSLTSVSTTTAGWASLGNPALSVVEGVSAEIGVAADSATTSISGGNAGAAIPKLPSAYFPSTGAGTALPTLVVDLSITVSGPPGTITDATWQAGAGQRAPLILFRIT